MRKSALVLILIITVSACYAQQDEYQTKLSERLNQIRQLRMFDNSSVVYDEKTAYGSDFQEWESKINYYEGDHVLFETKMYEAIEHSINRKPNVSIKIGSQWLFYAPTCF